MRAPRKEFSQRLLQALPGLFILDHSFGTTERIKSVQLSSKYVGCVEALTDVGFTYFVRIPHDGETISANPNRLPVFFYEAPRWEVVDDQGDRVWRARDDGLCSKNGFHKARLA